MRSLIKIKFEIAKIENAEINKESVMMLQIIQNAEMLKNEYHSDLKITDDDIIDQTINHCDTLILSKSESD